MLQPNDTVCGYVLLEMLGGGAVSEVWRARRDGDIVALKLLRLPPKHQADPNALLAEAQTCVTASNHPNLLALKEVCLYQSGPQPVLAVASEFQPDGTLQDWLTQQLPDAPSLATVITLMDGILQGLAALHENSLLHGNLNPSNIFWHKGQPRLADFGVRGLEASETPDYLAPEAWDGAWTEATDIWAAGVILYQMLAGRLPFQHSSRRETMRAILTEEPLPLPDSVPAELRAVVGKALQKEPKQRFSSAGSMRQALCAATELTENSEAKARRLQNRVAELEAEVERLRRTGTATPNQPVSLPAVAVEPVAAPYFTGEWGALRQVEPLGWKRALVRRWSGRLSRSAPAKALLLILIAGSIGFAGMRLALSTPPPPEQHNEAVAPKETKQNEAAPRAATTPAAPTQQPQIYVQPVPGSELRLVRLPGPENNGTKSQHAATGDAPGLYLGETEVSRGLWRKIAEQPAVNRELTPEPWRKAHYKPTREKNCDECPVENVTWEDAQEFLARLNRLPNSKFTFRLPTDAEWEKACGDCRSQSQANTKENGKGETRPGGASGPANNFGLYDMYGNVWEWCQDQAPNDAERRVIRGGSWKRQDSWKNDEEEHEGYSDGGFRVAATK